MKTTKFLSFLIFSFFLSFNAQANCDTCSVTAKLSVYQNGQCQWIMNDTSVTDTCSTHIFSIVDYGNGTVDTIVAGDTIPDIYTQGTYELCLTAYATYTDSLGTDTCTSTVCVEITKSICHNPFRKKSLTELSSQISIYPNPAKNNFSISFPEETEYLRVFSMDGKQVYYQTTLGTTKMNLAISDWESGIYLVELGNEKFTETQKLIIE